MLEYIVEKSLFAYDAEGANVIKSFIGQRINITNKFSFIIYQAINIKFIQTRAGKKRFRDIPQFISNHFSEYRPEYKELIQSLEISANEQKCEIQDLEFSDFPEVKW